MKLTDLTVHAFIEEVASSSPAPGGGSVSALASTVAAGLLNMVGNLTAGRKKFFALDSVIQKQFIDTEKTIESLRHVLLELIERDTLAFQEVMSAYKLPKESNQEQDTRKKAIHQATIGAIEVPLQVMETSLSALNHCSFILQYGNKNAASDVGVAAELLYTGLRGAMYNVIINLYDVAETEKAHYLETIHSLEIEAKNKLDIIRTTLERKL